jgi:hypothetical protein
MAQQPSLTKTSLTPTQAAVQEELMSQTFQHTDLATLAKESILWVDELPKQHRISAMAEMKQWVRSEGLNWDLWWQYCQHARQEVAQIHPARQSAQPFWLPPEGDQRLPSQAQPTWLAGQTSQSHSGVRRVMSQPHLGLAPKRQQAYNAQVKARPNTSKAQSAALVNQYMMAEHLRLGEMARPSTTEEWHRLAVEAVEWLDQKPKEEQAAALSQMRQWAIQMGLAWDQWWTFCRRFRDANDTQSVMLQRQRMHQEVVQSSPMSPVLEETHDNMQPGAPAMDAGKIAEGGGVEAKE